MLTILLHSSKTMRTPHGHPSLHQAPALLDKAIELNGVLQKLTQRKIETIMQVSPAMATKTHALLSTWTTDPDQQLPAIDAFLGDIYSGLQVGTLSADDRGYANDHLYILSGLYGVLRALDSIHPYRLEMGYRLPSQPFQNLARFWSPFIKDVLPPDRPIVNLSAVEYTQAVLPYIPDVRVVAPRFLTMSPKTNEPTFVVVHAKIARGAFAGWLIRNRIASLDQLEDFSDLGYHYEKALSTPEVPVYICKEFGGIGLSVRLT